MTDPDYLENALNMIKENIVMFDKVGTILYANKSFKDLLESIISLSSSDHIMGKNIWKLLPQLIETSLYKNVVESISKKEVRCIEWKSSISDKFYETTIYPSDTATTAIVRDITTRKKAEETISINEERFRSVLNNSSDVIYRLNLQTGHYEYMSATCKTHLGFESEELMAMSNEEMLSRVHPEELPALRSALAKASKTGKSFCEYRFLGKDGKYSWWSNYLVVSKDHAGKPLYRDGFVRNVTESKKSEKALRNTEKLLRSVTNGSQDAIYVKDRQSHWLFANPALERIVGKTSAEVLGKTDSEIYGNNEASKAIMENDCRIMDSGQAETVEESVEYPDGRHSFISVKAPRFDDKGQVIGLIGISHDITERKKMEEKVNQSMQTFLELIERAPLGIYVVDSRFHIAHMNKGSQTGAFRNVRPVIGRDFNEAMHILWPEPTASEIIAHFRHTLETGEPYYSPQFINPRNDTEIVESYEWELQRMRLPDGQYGVICYYFDSTKMRETERSLNETQNKLKEYATNLERLVEERTKKLEISSLYARNLIEASLDPLMTINLEGKITDVNKATELATGCSRDLLIGSDFSDYFTEPKKAQAGYKQVFAEGFVRDYPLAIKHKSEKTTNVLYNATVYRNESGEILGVFAAARDVTELKKAEAQTQEAIKKLKDSERLAAIGATAGMVGHDIRNPLQAIVGDLYLIDNDAASLPTGEIKKSLQESVISIQGNLQYIDKIIVDLQDYAKRLNPCLEKINLEKVIEEVLLIIPIADNLKVVIDIEKGFPDFISDFSMVKRILFNLVNNAVQAMPKDGTLTIRAFSNSDQVFVVVEDTGVGIPEDIKPKLFTPMLTTKSKGQGFGLAVVKRFVEALNGTITFESQEERGTKFTIGLPINKASN